MKGRQIIDFINKNNLQNFDLKGINKSVLENAIKIGKKVILKRKDGSSEELIRGKYINEDEVYYTVNTTIGGMCYHKEYYDLEFI